MLPNTIEHCSMYLLGFFNTRPDRVILVMLGAIGFDELMVANGVTRFGKLVVSSETTLSINLVVVDIKLL